jgi:hypothetical protein
VPGSSARESFMPQPCGLTTSVCDCSANTGAGARVASRTGTSTRTRVMRRGWPGCAEDVPMAVTDARGQRSCDSNFQVCQILRDRGGDIEGEQVTKVTAKEGYASQTIMGKICTSGPPAAMLAFRSMLAEGIPVRWNDFSQSELEGPRMLPSM